MPKVRMVADKEPMKLYHYVKRPHTVFKDGLLSIAANPNADLSYYMKRSGSETHDGVCRWMEGCFEGRSRGIRVLIEPMQFHERTQKIKDFFSNCDLFEIDVEALEKDGLIDAVYVSPSVLEKEPLNKNDEGLYKISGIKEIDFTPNDYNILDDEKGWRFAFMRYYLLVMKNGIIEPKYLKKV